MKRGFTLLELMVASLLLAMLVTILTMIFNQSSIAWTTGIASVVGLGDVRRDMAVVGVKADGMIDPQKGVRIVSVWKSWDPGQRSFAGRTGKDASDAYGRTLDKDSSSTTPFPLMTDPYQASTIAVGSGSTDGKDTYVVGVTSDGPDRQQNTWDDITTLPAEVD